MKRMKLLLFTILALFAFSSLQVAIAQGSYYDLKVKKTVETTPSKDIQRVNSCWSNVGAALVEAEMIRTGKGTVDLAEMDFIHNAYLLKSDAYLSAKGEVQVTEKCIPYDVFKLMDTYGMAPESAYMKSDMDPMDKESGEMDAIIRGSLRRALDDNSGQLNERYQGFVDAALTMHIGDTKMNFTYDGNDYTPKSFAAKAGINSSDYIMLTSDTRTEINKPFVLELKQNWGKDKFYNVHANELFKAIKDAIENGYAVGWYGLLDGNMIFADEAVALVAMGKMPGELKGDKVAPESFDPIPEKSISEEDRQKNFETLVNGGIVDYMTLYGVSVDKEGNDYIIGKDACAAGDKSINMSKAFVKLNTVYVLVNKNGLPTELKSKLGL
jgi:bleomycin hydrolase